MSIDPLIMCVYQEDGPKDWKAIAASGPPWHGAILKATQGAYYEDAAWFDASWHEVRDAGGERYGLDWLRGAYHYLDIRLTNAALEGNNSRVRAIGQRAHDYRNPSNLMLVLYHASWR